MKLVICRETPARLPTARLRRLFDRVVQAEVGRNRAATVNLIICSDTRIRSLNRRFRSIDRATDVLSFCLDSLDAADDVLGEIYISMPYVRRQAASLGRGVFEEIILLFCHGMLHLFGYDHDTKRREHAMFERQSRYLKILNGGK